MCKICSKVKIFGAFIVNFEQISYIALVFSLLIFTDWFGISSVDFEQVNAGRVTSNNPINENNFTMFNHVTLMARSFHKGQKLMKKLHRGFQFIKFFKKVSSAFH